MLLRSYAFTPKQPAPSFFYDVYTEIQNYRFYFYKFAGKRAEEAMERTLMHTLTHFNEDKGSLADYIKKLARVITKDNGKLVFVDFIEQTLSEDIDEDELQPNVQTKRVRDFTDELIDRLDNVNNKRTEISAIALESMKNFVMLCKALIAKDSSAPYYDPNFKKSCLKIQARCDNFNDQCLKLFAEFGDDFEWFMSLDENNEGVWKEYDILTIQNNMSKRFKLINDKTGIEVVDADIEPFHLVGNLGKGVNRKRLIKVYYEDIWNLMCDKVDAEETNEIKFIIDDQYIIRTYGGSQSSINPDIYNYYDTIRGEILTNIIHDTGGRVVNVGRSCIYLIVSNEFRRDMTRVIKGMPISFEYEDITPVE